MKLIARQKIWLAIVLGVNLALWIIPSDVVEQIARDRPTMMGRYSRTHFYWNLGAAVVSLVSFYIDWSTGLTYRRRWFQVLAVMIVGAPSLVLVDFLLRTPQTQHYVRDRFAFHRPENASFEGVFEDRPQAQRSFPNAPPGYGRVSCLHTTDHRGFRNPRDAQRTQYDIVVLGDSFAEGSSVSDEQVWPARLARQSGRSVYNLGMSSYDPLHYLESLREYGLAMAPHHVLCLIYEGNDFRSAKADDKRLSPSLSMRLVDYLDRSPVLKAADALLTRTFGAINCDGPVCGAEAIDWLPLAMPAGAGARYYAFEPKQLRDLWVSREEFAVDRHWLNPRGQLAAMNELCQKAGATLVIIYAPTKAHVVLPPAAERLSAAKIRAYTALSAREELPPAEEFLPELLQRADAKEAVVAEWCARSQIPFLSLTAALRRAAVAGTHVYYTYDQHWSPDGHAVVADAVGRFVGTLE
ncbi:MAG: hypothetical protein HY763_15290 [Planctomycetes bacterium]|nr:hypothetical protein [Planctomycetota bacterium]